MGAPRKDVHRPSTANPGEYELLGDFYSGSDDGWFKAYKLDHQLLRERTVELLGRDSDEDFFDGWFNRSGQCDCCGARFAHGAAYLHGPSRKVIHVGQVCARNLFDYSSRNEAARSREHRDQKRLERVARERAEWDAAHPEEVAILQETVDGRWDDRFLKELADHWTKRGPLTERQLPWVTKVRDRLVEQEAQAARDALNPPPPAEPVPVGRQQLTGTVISTKTKETDFGTRFVMTVQLDGGGRVWGTRPDAVIQGDDGPVTYDPQRGDRVAFTATVTASDDDDTFGFFKRPAKLTIVQMAEEAAQ